MKDTEKIVTALHLVPQLDIGGMTNEILVLRQRTINTAIIKQLQDLMHEKGINELYAIDESKVLQLIKEHQALEFIKKVLHIGIKEYHLSNGKSRYVLIYDTYYSCSITEEDYILLKGVLS